MCKRTQGAGSGGKTWGTGKARQISRCTWSIHQRRSWTAQSLFAIKQNRFRWERSQSNLLWYYGYCHKIQHCASLSTRSKICRWKISREHGLEWLWQLSKRMCRTLDKTLCYRWGCLYRTHHSELPFVHWSHVVQRRYIRFTRWLQWLCWPTCELGRNTEVGIRSTTKKEVTRFIQIMTMRGDL